MIEDRQHLWNKMIMIKEQATDPARLWQNRGGQLLKEEKERKIIQKVNKVYILLIVFYYYFQNINQLLEKYFKNIIS